MERSGERPECPSGGVATLVLNGGNGNVQNDRIGLTIGPTTNRNGYGDALDLELAVAAVERALAC